MNGRHEPVVIIVAYVIALDLLEAARTASEVLRDTALDCTCPGRTEAWPCLEHQHELAQAEMLDIAHRYVRTAMLAAARPPHQLRHGRPS